MKILIIPSETIYKNRSNFYWMYNTFTKRAISRFFPHLGQIISTPRGLREKSYLDYLRLNHINNDLPGNDLAWWGSINQIDGIEAYILGKYNNAYFNKKNSEGKSRWPVLYGFKPFKSIGLREACSEIDSFDAALISTRYPRSFSRIILKIKNRNILSAFIDAFDDEAAYSNDQNYLLSKLPFSPDIFFKKDLPIGMKSRTLKPLSPMPYDDDLNSRSSFISSKNFNGVFFSGSYREGISRIERMQICNFLESHIQQSKIFLNKKKLPKEQYDYLTHESLIMASPAGRVWDSFRHTEIGMLSAIPLLPINDCELTWDIFKDEENSIVYNPNSLDSSKYLEGLKRKIEIIISNPQISLKMRENIYSSVYNKCSRINASEYLLTEIDNILSA